jgi:hypothetical protein
LAGKVSVEIRKHRKWKFAPAALSCVLQEFGVHYSLLEILWNERFAESIYETACLIQNRVDT